MGVLTWALCLPLKAGDLKGWQAEPLRESSSGSKPNLRQIDELLLKMMDRWNAHDVEGHLALYWNSPELLVIVDSEQFNGWQQFHDSYINEYPDRNAMGFIQPIRIQIKMLKPDLALALSRWSLSLPNSEGKVVGDSTINLQKFGDGWKIIASHTSTSGDTIP
jgi:ketosteroid isomerase-like protein